ncbi:TetR family transcriptional regulator, partial [Sinorhizobium meliloti]
LLAVAERLTPPTRGGDGGNRMHGET